MISLFSCRKKRNSDRGSIAYIWNYWLKLFLFCISTYGWYKQNPIHDVAYIEVMAKLTEPEYPKYTNPIRNLHTTSVGLGIYIETCPIDIADKIKAKIKF
jgi:hypothetical protein